MTSCFKGRWKGHGWGCGAGPEPRGLGVPRKKGGGGHASRIEMLSKAPADKCKAVVPLKLKQFEGLQSLRVGAVLRKYVPLLGVFADRIVPMPCNVSSPNLFRMRYERFL